MIHVKHILPFAVYLFLSLLIHTIFLHKPIKEIDWVLYFIAFVVSILTSRICDKFKK